MGRGGGSFDKGDKNSPSGFTLPAGFFYIKPSSMRFGNGFDSMAGRSLFPFRIVNPVWGEKDGVEVRSEPLFVANVNYTPIVLMQVPREIRKEGFYLGGNQRYGLKHLTYEVVQELAQQHAPDEANLYMPTILELSETFLEIHERVVRENVWRRPNSKGLRQLEEALSRVDFDKIMQDDNGERRSLRLGRAEDLVRRYESRLRREKRKIDRLIDRKARDRWGKYVDNFHPVLGIKYYSVPQVEIDRLNEIVTLVDSPQIPWPQIDSSR